MKTIEIHTTVERIRLSGYTYVLDRESRYIAIEGTNASGREVLINFSQVIYTVEIQDDKSE